MILNKKSIVSLIFIWSSLDATDEFLDSDFEDILDMKSEIKVDVGSRNGNRNFLDSNVPVDVITYQQIDSSGLTSLSNLLRYFVPSFNAPETSVADGSDHVRAFSLRGMSPDQVLVLINGKRVHTSALLHVNGVIGRGSSHVDLDTIALKSIEKIEILRDGAAAQYGSDAISGVINIILKGFGHKNSIAIHGGKRKAGDGELLHTDLFLTKQLKYEGFVNLTLAVNEQKKTNRAGLDTRLDIPAQTTYVGLPHQKQILAVLNIEAPQSNNINLYADATFSHRDSKASAFFRPSNHNENTNLVYPNGFLPLINAKILDYSTTLGIQGRLSNSIEWDFSNKMGYNCFKYYVDNSMNYSLGLESPTSFNNGGLSFMQNSTNLDLKRSWDKFNLSSGIEYRYENYKISAGDLESYTGTGSQGFAGYNPQNEVDSNRNSYAIYIDSTYKFNDSLNVEGAGRYEKYSDFGSTTNAKLALSYKAIEELLLRSSASTGFRAPSLAQSNYSQTSSFVDTDTGLLSTHGTFKLDHEVAQTLGAKELKPEKSIHLTAGTVYQLSKKTFAMVDYFYTKVNDRIMLSNELSGVTPTQEAILESYGVSKARFFTNGIDTLTQGIDIKLKHEHIFEDESNLALTFWYSYNKNEVINYNESTISKESSLAQIDRIENGQPKESMKILTNYQKNNTTYTLNLNRFGSYRQVIAEEAYSFDAEWVADLDISYKIKENLIIAIGGHNIFNMTPNKWDGLSGIYYGYDGIKQYSRYSPFGYSGAYYYITASYDF